MAGVVVGESETFGGHAIEIGGRDAFLAVGPKVSIAEVIRVYQNNIGPGSLTSLSSLPPDRQK